MYKKGLALVSLVCLLLSGCGKVASTSDLLKYAESSFGESELVSAITTDSTSTLILKDKEYSFEYRVSSYLMDINIDGSSFGNLPAKSSSFGESYIDCFKALYSDTLNEIDGSIDFYTGFRISSDDAFIELTVDTDVDYESVCKTLVSAIKEYDTRGFLLDSRIRIYHTRGILVGEYDIRNEVFRSVDDLDADFAMISASEIMREYFDLDVTEEDLVYTHSDNLSIEDIEGLKDEKIGYRVGEVFDENNIKVWYYTYKGENWLIADCLISPSGHLYVTKLDKE